VIPQPPAKARGRDYYSTIHEPSDVTTNSAGALAMRAGGRRT
jgi:hypothetical protein